MTFWAHTVPSRHLGADCVDFRHDRHPDPRRRLAAAMAGLLGIAVPFGTATASGSGATDPEPHQRIAVLAEEVILADVLELGLHPIASTATVPEAGFQGLDGYDTGGIEILSMTSLNLEQVAALEPDTIVTLQFWVDQVGEDALRGLGDLVVVPDGLSEAERVTLLGELLDRPAEAAALVAELEAATVRAATVVPDDCAVSLAAIYAGPSPAAFVDGPWDLPTAILNSGCRLVPDATQATPDGNGRVYLSMEQLGLLDTPLLVLLQSDLVEGEPQALATISDDPLWQQLPAVRSGDVVVFDRLGYPGAAGQIRFLDEFASHVAGEPS